MVRFKIEQTIEYYNFNIPSLPSKSEFNKLKNELNLNQNKVSNINIEDDFKKLFFLILILLFFASLLIILITGKYEFQNPFLNMGLILISIIAVSSLGASGFVFNKINKYRAKKLQVNYFKSLNKMTLESLNYSEFTEKYTKKYYKKFSKSEIEAEIKYINRYN